MPRRHESSLARAARWNGFSRWARASAALVSTSTCSALVGKPQLPDRLGVQVGPATGEQENPVLFDEVVACHAFDAQSCPVQGNLDLARG